LVVRERHANVLEQLLDAWVSHLVILSRDKDARRCNKGHHLLVALAAEVADAEDVLADVRLLQVCVKHRHTVVERFRMVLELSAQVAHPLDVELTRSHIKGSRVEAFAEALALDEAVEDLIHWDFCLKLLIARTDAANHVCSGYLIVTISVCLLNGSEVLESAASRAIPVVTHLLVAISQETRLSALAPVAP